MDSLALVATIVLVALIAWIVARNLGRRHARGRNLITGADAGTGAAWSDGSGSRRQDAGHDGGVHGGHLGAAGGSDGGGGGD